MAVAGIIAGIITLTFANGNTAYGLVYIGHRDIIYIKFSLELHILAAKPVTLKSGAKTGSP